jgi:hypothetical protein
VAVVPSRLGGIANLEYANEYDAANHGETAHEGHVNPDIIVEEFVPAADGRS